MPLGSQVRPHQDALQEADVVPRRVDVGIHGAHGGDDKVEGAAGLLAVGLAELGRLEDDADALGDLVGGRRRRQELIGHRVYQTQRGVVGHELTHQLGSDELGRRGVFGEEVNDAFRLLDARRTAAALDLAGQI